MKLNISQCSLEEFANEMIGNWESFNCFVWHKKWELDNPEKWCIWYTSTRDSDLLEISNGEYIQKRLQQYIDKDSNIYEESHNHFACGYINGYSVLVRDGNEEITEVFQEIYNLVKQMSEYPLLDEEDYSEKELKALWANIEEIIKSFDLIDEISPSDLVNSVYQYLSDNFPSELENKDGNGAYPSEELIEEYLEEMQVLNS